jgi:hypothetical protein
MYPLIIAFRFFSANRSDLLIGRTNKKIPDKTFFCEKDTLKPSPLSSTFAYRCKKKTKHTHARL